jgi:hypothetical protein
VELLAESLLHARLNLQPTPERPRGVALPTV